MRSAALILLLFVDLSVSAQTFSGKVEGTGGKPLSAASVIAAAGGNSTVAYCITDDEGLFTLNIPSGGSPSDVVVSYMGYQRKIIPFSDFKDGMTVRMVEGDFKLKEVKVRSERIRSVGDTLTYSVAGFRQAQDRSIADVIAKMPGLEVKSDGRIEYQGKAIDKFYVEGLDLMGSQYGVANQNISVDKVMSVQVLENHQPVKSLRNVSFSESASLNLVLKDDAKAVWTGAADIGLGCGEDFLYDGRLMGMRFDRKFQSLMMYKGDDIGRQLDDEVLDLTALLKGRSCSGSGILSMMSAGSPDLAEDRYTFNHSHLVAGNWLWKTGKDSELRLQGNGFIDRTDMSDRSSTTYLTVDGLPVITEEQDIVNTRSEWKGEADYQYNGPNTYIKNNLKGYIDFNQSAGSITCNGEKTDLSVKPYKRSLTEDFRLSHTTSGGNVYNIESWWSYNSLPGRLLTINGMTECLNLGSLSTQNDVRYMLKVGRHYLNNEAGINYDRQNMGFAMDGDSEQSNVWDLLRFYWEPSLSFLFGKHRVDLKTRLSYARQSYCQSSSNHFWADPSFSWDWKASALSEFSALVSCANTPLSGRFVYDIPIFTDYRTVRSNRGETGVTHDLTASAGYKYSNPVSGLFFNIRPIFSRISGNILYQSSLLGDIYTMSATDKDYTLQTSAISGRVSKSFVWAKALIGVGAYRGISDYSLLVSDEVNDARFNTSTAEFDFSLRPLKGLSIEGKSSLRVHNQRNLSRPELSSGGTTDWEHYLNLHIIPAGRWMMSVKNELFSSSEEGIGTNYFLDFALSYKTARWELSLSANNIVGTSEFERRNLGNTVETCCITRLRPREFLLKWSIDL